jgi:hypothetical protein
MERALRDVPLPATLPAYGGIHADRVGNTWVSDHTLPGAQRLGWTVFDSTGRELGHLFTPNGFAVSEIGNDYLLGIQRDELGVERVAMYRLTKQE